jgi:shikimate dehydrogenase
MNFADNGTNHMKNIADQSQTRLCGVFGHPIGHSFSPAIHNAAFRETGFNGVYLAFDVTDLSSAAAGIRALNILGVSITIPHKVSIMEYLDACTPMAMEIGAVNTVINRDGRLTGDNTDGLGAVSALAAQTAITDRRVAVIGAGGAARAIAFAIRSSGGALTVVNRSVKRGEALAAAVNAEFIPLAEFAGNGYDILVNTTSVGMKPDTDAMATDPARFDSEAVVMDIVYNPLETRWLRAAKKRGCTVVDGLAMFIHQGALQFELWTGQTAPRAVMRSAVLKSLGYTDA